MSKRGQIVCGDNYLCERTADGTEFVLCDGIGSGVYANIASITCASRLIELFRSGVSLRFACEVVAESMHRARTEDIPFSAFCAVKILNNGQFTIYTYEAPNPIAILDGIAIELKPHFYTVGYEILGEVSGVLKTGDSLIICSDGVTQAGLGGSRPLGIGTDGVAEYINRELLLNLSLREIPDEIIKMTAKMTGGVFMDDTTAVLLNCREATELSVLSGPPSNRSNDAAFAARLLTVSGNRAICGSTTAEIISRELGRDIRLYRDRISFDSPPEYIMEGADIVTEGAVVLNQIYNIMDADRDDFFEESPARKLCAMMRNADIITFIVGNAQNDAHNDLIFKQLGIRPRKTAIKMITEKLKSMGKLVVTENY